MATTGIYGVFHSSMTTFDCISPDDVFDKVLALFYNGKRDENTIMAMRMKKSGSKRPDLLDGIIKVSLDETDWENHTPATPDLPNHNLLMSSSESAVKFIFLLFAYCVCFLLSWVSRDRAVEQVVGVFKLVKIFSGLYSCI